MQFINIGDGNFSVNSSGVLSATGANVEGSIDCSSLSISGTDILDSLNKIKGDYLSENSVGASKLKVEELIVGENITMGPNAYISWYNVTNTPYIPQTASDVGALSTSSPMLTYITSTGIYTGTINANQINTAGLGAEKIYKPNAPTNYATIGGSYADFILYNNNGEYFRIYDAVGGGGSFKCKGNTFLSFWNGGATPYGTWNFGNCDVTGLTSTAVFG